MKIEKLTGTPDFSSLAELIRRGLPPEMVNSSSELLVRRYEEHFNPRTDSIYLLMDGDRIVGWYRYSLWPRDDPETNEVHLLDIAVAESHQGKGHGTRLLRHCLETCTRLGYIRMYSATDEANQASIGLHESAGFHVHRKKDRTIVWVRVLRNVDGWNRRHD